MACAWSTKHFGFAFWSVLAKEVSLALLFEAKIELLSWYCCFCADCLVQKCTSWLVLLDNGYEEDQGSMHLPTINLDVLNLRIALSLMMALVFLYKILCALTWGKEIRCTFTFCFMHA